MINCIPWHTGGWSLAKSEKNYHYGKTKFLCFLWAVMDHFKEYLMYKPFLVHINNNPFTYLFTTPNLDACRHRWVVSMANFNFMIKYQTGKNNAMADALSQVNESLNAKEVKAMLDSTYVGCQE